MAHANNGVPSGSQSMFGKLLGLATGRTGQAAYPQNQPQGNHGYQQGSQSYGMQQMHPVQGHPQPLPNGYAPGPHQAPAAGWAQPGESTGQYSHGADPYYGHGTNNGERYTGHEGGFNQHSGGGYSH
ncbi:hypothetical protein ABBQ38_006492 [Trebouxia sp. C0009 RCD-2024]